MIKIQLTERQATALLLVVKLGMDTYEEHESDPQVWEALDRILPFDLSGMVRAVDNGAANALLKGAK